VPTDEYYRRFEGTNAFILSNTQCRMCDTLLELLDIPEDANVRHHLYENLSSRIVEGY
jgi:hypothetical protein